MRRTTTESHTLKFPMPLQNVDDMQITYAQSGNIVLTKDMDDVVIDDKTVSVELTQQETKQFTAEIPVEVQAKIAMSDGKVMASKILRIPATRVLNDAIFGDEDSDDDNTEETTPTEENTGGEQDG